MRFMNRWRIRRPQMALAGLLAVATLWPAAGRGEDCSNGSFSSTFELIQKAVFENRSCTNSVCHGEAAAGGLDLRAENAYENLLDKDSQTVPGWKLVVPGRRDASLLFRNLAAKTLPGQIEAPLRAMPPDPVPALTTDQLEAVRRWIESGAPKDGVVPGTAELLDACLPPPEPISIKPLDPPAPGQGIQIRMPKYVLQPHSERETCFASYFDVTDQVPAEFRGPSGTTFRYRRNDVRQDPLSHHLIVNLYTGSASPDDPAWGPFTCRGGEKEGQPCPPMDQAFCGTGLCSTTPRNSIACIGFGPSDLQAGINQSGFTGSQETASEQTYPPGVYREVPMKGMIVWNSHAFNLTDQPGKLEAWMNFDFAAPEQQITPTRTIFDTKTIFKMRVPPYQTEEICTIFNFPRNAKLYELSSHAHQRMKRWRTFLGSFTCQGGPANGQACEPLGYDMASPDVCAGAPCKSLVPARVGDCDRSNEVSVDEIVRGVNIALGAVETDTCGEADTNLDGEVTVDEILRGVNAALSGVPAPTERDPMDSLLYVSLVYNDPIVLPFEPALDMNSDRPDERALTYCGLYDNGFLNPDGVKKRSTSPNPPANIPGVGGPCKTPSHCTEGKTGAACVGSNDRLRNASCDSSPGAGDGVCDACLLTGGVTTEDEMFILMGQYYVP